MTTKTALWISASVALCVFLTAATMSQVDPSDSYGDLTPLADQAELFSFEDPEISDTEFIQELVDMTVDGGVCEIPAGEYEVSGVSLRRPITIESDGLVEIRPIQFFQLDEADGPKINEHNYVFAVWSDDVVIEGIKFDSSAQPGSVDIVHYRGDNLSVRSNTFVIGESAAGILSKAEASNCTVENNLFSAVPGMRTFPMIQIGKTAKHAIVRGNTLEGDSPEMLTEGFLSNFITVESKSAEVEGNEFAYMGGAQDEYGYEDEESKLAFAGVTKEEIGRLNPWARIASKENPPTGDGILLMLGLLAAFAIQLVLSLKLMAKAKKKI